MTITGLSTRRSGARDISPQVNAVCDGASTDGEVGEDPAVAARLAAAARATRDAAALGLAAPVSVTVTGHGCSAVLDTEGVLAWARLAEPRPTWTTYRGSAYLRLDGVIAGVPWQLYNGVPAPEVKPSPRPRPAATAGAKA